MPMVGAALGGILGLGGALSFGGIGTALIKIAAGFGLTYVARALAGKPEDLLGQGSTPSGVQAEISAGDSKARSFIVGRWATAGTCVYMRAWGETNKVPHAYLVQVIKLSDLPIEGVLDIYVDGVKINWQDGVGNKGYASPDYRKNGIDYLWIKVHKGDQGSADDYLTSKFPGGPRDWGANHVGLGVAYAIVTSRYSEKLYSGARPECLFVLNGLKLYNPVKDSTVGGTGTHLWSNPNTWEFTHNPAVIIYNLMRGIRHNGRWFYGLQTVQASQLPFASWAAAINECAMTVTNKDGSQNPQYRCGAEIRCDTEVGLEIQELLKTCNGKIADCGGIYKPKVGAHLSSGTPVLTFTDDSLMMTDEHDFAMFPSLDDVVNGVDATFVFPDDAWQEKALPTRRSADYVKADDDRENIADVTYAHVWDKSQAQRLSKSILNESRRFRRHVIVLPPEAYLLEPLDFVKWNSSRNGYIDKLFRVESIADRSDGDQVVGIQEVDPTDYNWTPGIDEIDVPAGVQINDRAPTQSIISFTAEGYVIDGGTSIDRPGIRMTWNGSDIDDVTLIRFEVRMLSPTGPLVAQDQMTSPGNGVYILSVGLASGIVYVVRAQYDNAGSTRDFAWTGWITITTPETPIHIEAFADDLENLINAGSASGKVITEQIPTAQLPLALANAYRITVYGTGVHAGESAGFYLYVTKEGVPGALFDIKQVAMGDLTTRQFPFTIEGGVVKITRGAVQALQAGQIAAGAIEAGHIHAGAVTAASMSDASIPGGKLTDDSILGTKIRNGQITGSKIATGSTGISRTNLVPKTITAAEIADATIVGDKIAGNTILGGHIHGLTITGDHIVGNSIKSGHILTGQIKVTHLSEVEAEKIDYTRIKKNGVWETNIYPGAVTAEKIYSGTIEANKIQTKHFKSNEVSTRYYGGQTAGRTASVEVKRRGGVVLIGTFQYKCDKGEEVEMIIVKRGGDGQPLGNSKWRIKPGDDINGTAQVITMVDQTNDNIIYDMKPTGNTTADISNTRLLALRVAL